MPLVLTKEKQIMDQLKVLMADDEPDVLEVMAKKVSAEGFDVVTAQDGEEALEKIRAEVPDVILLDITMPKKDGFQILQEIRENPTTKKWQPVIMVSAHRELDDMNKSYSLEADHYITKPCSSADIIKAIRLMVSLIPQKRSKEEADDT